MRTPMPIQTRLPEGYKCRLPLTSGGAKPLCHLKSPQSCKSSSLEEGTVSSQPSMNVGGIHPSVPLVWLGLYGYLLWPMPKEHRV